MPADLKRRALLSKAVSRMLLIVLLAFLFVLFRSLGGAFNMSGNADNSLAKDEPIFADVIVGQTVLRRLQSQRVWVSRFSESQRAQAVTLQNVVSSTEVNCQMLDDPCVLSADSARDGIDLVYSAVAPAQLPTNLPWFGGFVDPNNGRLYDLWGRAYAFQNIQPLMAIPIVQ